MAYFALIPLSGLLLGRRSMNIFAGICVATILAIFYLEWVGLVTPSVNTRSLLDDLVVLFFAIALNSTLHEFRALPSE